jgi:branched-chain amino acid transport system ATP-binding protein
MTVLENLMVAQHNALMRASGLTLLGLIGAPSYRARPSARDRSGAKFWLDRSACSTAPTMPPASLPYGASAGSKSRARCAPIRRCCASTNRPPASTARIAELNELLLSIRDEHGTSILLIEHDMSVVMRSPTMSWCWITASRSPTARPATCATIPR